MDTFIRYHPSVEQLFDDADKLHRHPDNPRSGDISAIAQSVARNGVYRPIVAQRSTGAIIAGNHLFTVLADAGEQRVPVLWVECTDEEAKRILVADNGVGALGGYDDALLANLLQDLGDLDGTGYNFDDLDDLLARLDAVPALTIGETGASYAETDEEHAARAERSGADPTKPRKADGLREMWLVLTNDDYNEAVELIAQLRKSYGDNPAGAIVLAALRAASRDAG
jgi:ParB-like chromosome segregation protein Spo0J